MYVFRTHYTLFCILTYFSGVIQQEFANFHKAINERSIEWACQMPEYGSTITERYSHSACYYNKSLYVFGGCTSSSTTFNDLWRFDLCSLQWIRPLALGMWVFEWSEYCYRHVLWKRIIYFLNNNYCMHKILSWWCIQKYIYYVHCIFFYFRDLSIS